MFVCKSWFSNVVLWCVGVLAAAGMVSAAAVQEKKQPAAEEPPVLVGQVLDTEGNPVTDAELTISGSGASLSAKTDDKGHYEFAARRRPNAPALKAGEYQVRIESQGWVGQTNFRKLPRLQLKAGVTAKKNFTLKPAARVQIRVVDENGDSMRRVTVHYKAVKDEYNARSVRTDETGTALIGGLAADGGQYTFGCKQAGYGFARVTMKITEAKLHDVKMMELQKGKSVKGTSICSDGKPPAGWRLDALPLWWKFGVYPNSSFTKIEEDGSFELKDIVPGEYRISISVPMGNGGSTGYPVMSADLLKSKQPLMVKMNHPSPSSMGSLAGTIKYEGDRKLTRGIWLEAYSIEGGHSGSVYVSEGKKTFKIDSLPKGRYRISAAGREIEPLEMKNVLVPADDLEVTFKIRGPLMLAGQVLLPDGRTPVTKFKLSVVKLRTLSGPGYVQDASWISVSDANGKFSTEVNSPGVYQVSAFTDGYAPTTSGRFNTTSDKGLMKVVLKKGVSLAGVVVDDAGEAVAGATVKAASFACRDDHGRSSDFVSNEGAVTTDSDGRFRFPNLSAGNEMLRVEREGYAATTIDKLDLSKPLSQPLRVILSKGGTIRGLVFDANGKRVGGRVLHFQNGQHGGDYEKGRLAKLQSDDRGFFQVVNLPSRLIYITCGDEWQTPGVARRTVLPQTGKRATVMFGGPKATTGAVRVNGEPLADTLVLLTGKQPNFGIMRAMAKTDADGAFQFFGPPPGVWTLYYYKSKTRRSDWGVLGKVELGPKPEDLGEFNVTTGPVTIRIDGVDEAELSNCTVRLTDYDATWPGIGRSIGTPSGWNGNQVVIEGVAAGDYELIVSRPEHPSFHHRLQVTADKGSRTPSIVMPIGTGSITGTVAASIVQPGRRFSLWSAKGDQLAYVKVESDGKFKAENLPAGEWVVRTAQTRTYAPAFRFELKDGESKTLTLNKAMAEPKPKDLGAVQIQAFTPDGALTPCRVTLTGPAGEIAPRTIDRGSVMFVAAPGDYTANISLKGFKPVTRSVTLKPTDGGTPADDWQTRVMLEELK